MALVEWTELRAGLRPSYHHTHFDDTRRELVLRFAQLPDEAFDFLVAQMLQIGRSAGGFQTESRKALEALSMSADDYFNKNRDQPPRAT